MSEHAERPDEVSSRDEEPARRGPDGDILGGETVGTEHTEMGAGAEADISHGDAGMGAERGADRTDDPSRQAPQRSTR